MTVDRITDPELDEWLTALQPEQPDPPRILVASAATVPGPQFLPKPSKEQR